VHWPRACSNRLRCSFGDGALIRPVGSSRSRGQDGDGGSAPCTTKSTHLNRFGTSKFKHLAGAKIGCVRSSKVPVPGDIYPRRPRIE
jgi:hypothetical protein